MNKNATYTMILFWGVSIVFATMIFLQNRDTNIISPEVVTNNVLPEITSVVDCDEQVVTWYVKNRKQSSFNLLRIDNGSKTIRTPDVKLKYLDVYEFDTRLSVNTINVIGEYSLNTEDHFYKITVNVNSKLKVDCK